MPGRRVLLPEPEVQNNSPALMRPAGRQQAAKARCTGLGSEPQLGVLGQLERQQEVKEEVVEAAEEEPCPPASAGCML